MIELDREIQSSPDHLGDVSHRHPFLGDRMVARAGLSVFEREAEEANGVRDMDGGQPVPAISDAGHAPVFSR